eukprot:scaffold42956_cov17-Tisochrysis_lutea.AAC.2
MKCVAVLGGGLMGSGIATALVQAGYEVLLKEVNQQFLEVQGSKPAVFGGAAGWLANGQWLRHSPEQAGCELLLKKVNWQFLKVLAGVLGLHVGWILEVQGGMQRVRANLQSRVKKGAMSQAAFDNAMSLLKGELTYDNFKTGMGQGSTGKHIFHSESFMSTRAHLFEISERADMVIEAVIEDIPLKQRIFAGGCRPLPCLGNH